MKGLELSKKFYETYGRPMLEEAFSDYAARIAVGLVGNGSECFGFDDAISTDHDFEPGFCLWLTEEDAAEIGNSLVVAYNRLPKEFLGFSLQQKGKGSAPKHGVFTIKEFYRSHIGLSGAPSNWEEWFYLPEYALATAVNGQVFRDDLGAFSSVRNTLKKGYPRDVKLKKLAARLALMAQSGQYNYPRCLKHQEEGAAQLALYEFVNHAFHAIFLLKGCYTPYYKWRFRALSELSGTEKIYSALLELLQENSSDRKERLIHKICQWVLHELKFMGLTASDEIYLEHQAMEVSKQIRDPEIRNLHLMETGE